MTREQIANDGEFLGVNAGRLSMCWDETPTGIFDSTQASSIVQEIMDWHTEQLRLAQMELLKDILADAYDAEGCHFLVKTWLSELEKGETE